jgi:hypothetical protein
MAILSTAVAAQLPGNRDRPFQLFLFQYNIRQTNSNRLKRPVPAFIPRCLKFFLFPFI